ncbi:hypothetical protein [Streptomyces atratus]|uniref:hypothetical protein n=1 Tax=Streptomyces atratus TaxID=1893 RepID=UPI003F53F46D
MAQLGDAWLANSVSPQELGPQIERLLFYVPTMPERETLEYNRLAEVAARYR